VSTFVPGGRMAQHREELGITVQGYADLIGLSTGAVGSYLRQGRTPRLDRAVEIEQATGGAVRVMDWLPPEVRAQVESFSAVPVGDVDRSGQSPTLLWAAEQHIESEGSCPMFGWLDDAHRAMLDNPRPAAEIAKMVARSQMKSKLARKDRAQSRRKVSRAQVGEMLKLRIDETPLRVIAERFGVSDVTVLRHTRDAFDAHQAQAAKAAPAE